MGSGFPFLALLGAVILVFDDMKLNLKGVPEGIKVSIGRMGYKQNGKKFVTIQSTDKKSMFSANSAIFMIIAALHGAPLE